MKIIGSICKVQRFDVKGKVIIEFEVKYPMSTEATDAFVADYKEHEKWFRVEMMK